MCSSDLRRPSTAVTAPWSNPIEPDEVAACRSQNSRAEVRRATVDHALTLLARALDPTGQAPAC